VSNKSGRIPPTVAAFVEPFQAPVLESS